MCYGVTYDCTVTCLNTNLNTTKLAEGIIASDMPYNGCKIVCAAGQTFQDNWHPNFESSGIVGVGINPLPLLIIVVVIVSFICLFLKLQGWEPREPPTEPRN